MKAFCGAMLVIAGIALPAAAAPGTLLRGFSPSASEIERATESRYLSTPDAASALDAVTTIAARPHYAGTPADYALAVWLRDRMRAAGIRAELEPLTARVETPRELVLELAPPADLAVAGKSKHRHAAFPIALNLTETGDPADPAAGARAVGVPFDAGSGDGDVSAPLVYAGHGLAADFAALDAAHVDVRGAVVLVRYGAEFRGALAERAQDHGAAGVIFYNDPADDGAARGLVYPNGPWRPRTAVERGWVGNGIRIPVLPVSALNAQILLGSLEGSPGPAGWTGALPVDYPLARGPGRVHLIVALNRKKTTLWNTIGTIPGVHGDQAVIMGAHRDAWVYGAVDNGSGVATLLAVARGLGSLAQGGWHPNRTIVLAGWDGGEIGALGSRAYLDAHRFEIPRGCFAYLDADRTVTGPTFEAGAVAALAPLVAQAARDVPDPLTPAAKVYDGWARPLPRVAAPGGGSGDDATFLTAAGIPVAAMRFAGPFPVAGSSYDTLRYATLFSDADWSLHRAAAQLYGLAALRLADAETVPYTFASYPALIRGKLEQLAARAAADGLLIKPEAAGAALARLAHGANRFERGEIGSGIWADELAAVRTLDLLLYGIHDQAPVALPELSTAVSSGDQARIDDAFERTVAAIDQAADALAQ
jgi:N-acetylated-alpha-linked acidic dipeptidase